MSAMTCAENMASASPVVLRLQAARHSLVDLVGLDGESRRRGVRAMATAVLAAESAILQANQRDLEAATTAGQSVALIDRLRLDASRLAALAAGLRQVAELPDPLADDGPRLTRPNGLQVRQKPAPLGVIAMVYEARPNVTADAAALCFMAGNACVLRGGREARHSNQAIAAALQAALREQGLPAAAVQVLDDPDRSQLHELLGRDDLVDLVIPRGGEALIRHVVEHSRIPVIRHYQGVCHLYVDRVADLNLAGDLLVDGKCSRPAVCNALECLLVHADIAAAWLPRVGAMMQQRGIAIRACPRALAWLPAAQAASDADWGHEFLDRVLAVRVVDSTDDALAHIRRYGSHHSEVIASTDPVACGRFVAEVDASCVLVNASSRFNDGGELGLGAEIGISTSKLHAYGPMGLAALTCRKWVVEGTGQVRHPESRSTP